MILIFRSSIKLWTGKNIDNMYICIYVWTFWLLTSVPSIFYMHLILWHIVDKYTVVIESGKSGVDIKIQSIIRTTITIRQIPNRIQVLHPNSDLELNNSINILLVFFNPYIPASRYCYSPCLVFSIIILLCTLLFQVAVYLLA